MRRALKVTRTDESLKRTRSECKGTSIYTAYIDGRATVIFAQDGIQESCVRHTRNSTRSIWVSNSGDVISRTATKILAERTPPGFCGSLACLASSPTAILSFFDPSPPRSISQTRHGRASKCSNIPSIEVLYVTSTRHPRDRDFTPRHGRVSGMRPRANQEKNASYLGLPCASEAPDLGILFATEPSCCVSC